VSFDGLDGLVRKRRTDGRKGLGRGETTRNKRKGKGRNSRRARAVVIQGLLSLGTFVWSRSAAGGIGRGRSRVLLRSPCPDPCWEDGASRRVGMVRRCHRYAFLKKKKEKGNLTCL
jgi:hypothetical protein